MHKAFRWLLYLEALIGLSAPVIFFIAWKKDDFTFLVALMYPIIAAAVVAIPTIAIGAVLAKRKAFK